MLPADRLMWTPESRDLADALKAASGTEAQPAIWVSGIFSQTAGAELSEAGLVLREHAGDQLESDLESP